MCRGQYGVLIAQEDAVARKTRFIRSFQQGVVLEAQLCQSFLEMMFHHSEFKLMTVQYSLSLSHQVFFRIRMISSNSRVLISSGSCSPSTTYMGRRVRQSCAVIPRTMLNALRRKFLLPVNSGSSCTTWLWMGRHQPQGLTFR